MSTANIDAMTTTQKLWQPIGTLQEEHVQAPARTKEDRESTRALAPLLLHESPSLFEPGGVGRPARRRETPPNNRHYQKRKEDMLNVLKDIRSGALPAGEIPTFILWFLRKPLSLVTMIVIGYLILSR